MSNQQQVTNQQQVMKKFPKSNAKKNIGMVALAILVVFAGAATGWLLSGRSTSTQSASPVGGNIAVGESTATEAGLTDEKAFPDTAEGDLETGGIGGEGTHHLVREGGESQYVYLTSTVIDLESFTGKKVQVWGETTTAKQAGWLMDVGKIKVTN